MLGYGCWFKIAICQMNFSGWVSKNQSSFTILDIQKLQRNYENSIALNEDIILKKVDEFIAKTEVNEKSIATVWVGLIAAILLIPIAYLMGKFNWNNVMHYLSHEFRVFYNLGEWNSNKIWEWNYLPYFVWSFTLRITGKYILFPNQNVLLFSRYLLSYFC